MKNQKEKIHQRVEIKIKRNQNQNQKITSLKKINQRMSQLKNQVNQLIINNQENEQDKENQKKVNQKNQ